MKTLLIAIHRGPRRARVAQNFDDPIETHTNDSVTLRPTVLVNSSFSLRFFRYYFRAYIRAAKRVGVN